MRQSLTCSAGAQEIDELKNAIFSDDFRLSATPEITAVQCAALSN